MRNLKGQTELPLYAHQCDVSRGKFLPHIHPDEARDVNRMCNKSPLRVISCKSDVAENCISELDGLSLSDIVAKGNDALADIHHFIPVIDNQFFQERSSSLAEDVIGVSLKDILSHPPNLDSGCVRMENVSTNEDYSVYHFLTTSGRFCFQPVQMSSLKAFGHTKNEELF